MDGSANHMDQSSPTENLFDSTNLHYDLRVEQPFFCFSGEGTTSVPVTLSVGKGAPLALYGDDPEPVKIGAKLYVNAGLPEEPVRGALVGEYRADSDAFAAQKGRHYTRNMLVSVAADVPGELILDIDLVKEGQFWGADLGHRPLSLVVTQRRVAIRPAQVDPLDMTEALMRLHDARAREARYEAVIFSLLNQLDKRDS
ncbi:hypothetical protein KZZ07_23495 [Mameliella sp. CS4]|uniref:hypothetical protein n=1 Tax=Mameliella sp. CS4 TaxID=2862329 RepID=UPI001C5EB00E|nr:hypothetical protein [Mameliella sp. CS4]MBW4985509.1 hypothetical protein [Mameliella sp. CS4]